MVKFSGTVSKDIQKRATRGRKIKLLILVLILNLLTLAIAVVLAFKFPKYCDVILTIWGGAVCFESLPCLFVPCKPQRADVFISDAEVYYHNLEFNEENRIDILEIDKVIDFGEFYLLKYEKGKEEIICVKELLTDGTLEEFESLFEEILIRKITLPRKKKKRKAKDEDLPLESALIIFDGYNSPQVMGKAELHENRKAAFLFFSIAAILIGVAIYYFVIGNAMRAVGRLFIAIVFFVMGALFWNMKQPGVVPPRHRIVITKDMIFDAHLILDTVRKLKVKRVRKVVDCGTFYEIRFLLKKSIVCEKSLLIKGSLDDFEKLFQEKRKA